MKLGQLRLLLAAFSDDWDVDFEDPNSSGVMREFASCDVVVDVEHKWLLICPPFGEPYD